MEKMPSFESEEKKEVIPVVPFDTGEKVEIPIKGENRTGLLDKIRKALGIGAAAVTAITGDGCEQGNKNTSFEGYGISTSEGVSTKSQFGKREGVKTEFSGYGISTETKDGKVIKSSFSDPKTSDGRY